MELKRDKVLLRKTHKKYKNRQFWESQKPEIKNTIKKTNDNN